MRSVVVAGGVILLAIGTPAYAQSACSGYPAGKTWEANPGAPAGTQLISDANAGTGFPGWQMEVKNSQHITSSHPVTVDGKTAQKDRLDPGVTGDQVKLKYRSDRWSFTGNQDLSITWEMYISECPDSMPAVKLRNGSGTTDGYILRLNFTPNVAGETGCFLPGWTGDEGAVITGGGRRIPNSASARYLPMAMNEWHTLRVDLYTNGTWEAWLDGGGSDHKHVTGINTQTTGSSYVQFGQTDSRTGLHEFSTACVAWGEGAEVPPQPSDPEEDCSNHVDDDGDTLVDCEDPDCDCSVPPPACGETTDIFERFNVNFNVSQLSGQVPPYWERSHYGAPAVADRDEAAVPYWMSNWDLSPEEPNQGPYYWPDPGPYVEERAEALAECMADGMTFEYKDQSVTCDPGDSACCNQWVPRAYHFSTPIRFELRFDQIPSNCGLIDDCYRGLITIEREVKADDLAFLPIDWTQPVTITADVVATDRSPDGDDPDSLPGDGKWETFVTFAGYTGTETRVEWDTTGITPADYTTVSYAMDAYQATPGGTTTLLLGIDFDYVALKSILPTEMSQAFFENVRITYTADLTKPLLHLNKMAIHHEILRGEVPPGDTFTITNAQPQPGTTLNYTIDDDATAPWLTTSGGDGQSTGESDFVTIHYDTAGLDAGTYVGVITVDSPDINKSAATITVTVEVVGERIALSETEFNHTVPARTSPPDDGFTVTNAGGGAMTYSIIDGDPDVPWLSEVPDTGGPLAGGEGDPITVTYSTADLPVGTYNATIEVSSLEADNSPQTIAVSVTIILTPPDYDSDGDVDQDDFAIFQGCYTGDLGTPEPGLCADYADLDGDGHVDQIDLLAFEGCASGPDVPFDDTCLAP